MHKNPRCQLGERLNYVSNLLVTGGHTHLGISLVNKLVFFHINRDFIRTHRENNATTIIQSAKDVVGTARTEASKF